jgi:hypothetical protein
MAGETAQSLSPQQAAQALAALAGFEDQLTSRVGALTGMVWGIVSAAIFVTYGMAPHVEPDWLLPFLWLPWTAAGVAVTIAAWKLHAVSLGRPHDRKQSVAWTLGFAAVFLAAMALMRILDLGDGAFPYMLVVNGMVGLFIALHVARRHGWVAGTPMLAAGLAIVGGAFLLAASGLPTASMGLASAALVGAAFLGGSLVSFLRG